MYLVCADLDGTLLTEKKHIQLLSRLYIKHFIKKGNIFAFNTGRTYIGCYKMAKEIKAKFPLICNNGLEIYIPEGNSYKRIANTFKYEPFLEFLAKVDSFIEAGIENTDMHVYLQNRSLVPWWLIHEDHKDAIVKEDKLINLINKDIASATIWVKEENKDEVLEITKQYSKNFKTIFHGTFDGLSCFQFIPEGKTKGSALLFLEEYYNIPHENTFGFGNDSNDLDLIKKAYFGVAISNSIEELKKESKYITKYDNEHNGVVRFLINRKIK